MISYSENITNLSGVPEGFDAKVIVQSLEKTQRSILHISRDDKRLEALKRALWFFAPQVPVFVFPAWDCLPYDRVSPNSDVSAARMAILAALAAGFDKPFLILTTLNAVTQYVPKREVLRDSSFVATVGRQVDQKRLRQYFTRMGFVQTPTVTEAGDYAIRGGIIDVFPPGEVGPVRMDMFGDELESARRFDPITQRTVEKLKKIEFAPVSEVVLDEESVARFRNRYRTEFGAAGIDDPLYEAVSAGRKHQGFEHWAPYFHDSMETLFDYVGDAAVFMDETLVQVHDGRWDSIVDQYGARMEALKAKSRMDTVYKPIAPETLYMAPEVFETVLGNRDINRLVALPQPTGPNALDMGGRIGRSFAPERQNEEIRLFESLADHISMKRRESAVVIASFSEGARERLDGLLADQDVAGMTKVASWSDVDQRSGSLSLVVWPLDQGFEAKGLCVISEQDVLGERLIRGSKRRKRAENFLTEASSLSVGDLVVHVDHGVARYHGLETVVAAGAPHDCLVLEYASETRLYLPVENIELLSRYGHESGMLDRLGGGAWQAKKAKLKERIREVADKLIRIAAERALRKSEVMEAPQDLWEAFCARFPYSETDDQLNAIEDVLEDMASGRPMDRLICGDVGFGKTEVALRAAFVAASTGTQVAIIAPTT